MGSHNNEKLKERKQAEELMSSCMAPLGIPDLNVPLDHEDCIVKSSQAYFDLNDSTLDEDCVIVKSAPAFDLNDTPLDDDDCVIVEPAQVFDLDVAKKLLSVDQCKGC